MLMHKYTGIYNQQLMTGVWYDELGKITTQPNNLKEPDCEIQGQLEGFISTVQTLQYRSMNITQENKPSGECKLRSCNKAFIREF